MYWVTLCNIHCRRVSRAKEVEKENHREELLYHSNGKIQKRIVFLSIVPTFIAFHCHFLTKNVIVLNCVYSAYVCVYALVFVFFLISHLSNHHIVSSLTMSESHIEFSVHSNRVFKCNAMPHPCDKGRSKIVVSISIFIPSMYMKWKHWMATKKNSTK